MTSTKAIRMLPSIGVITFVLLTATTFSAYATSFSVTGSMNTNRLGHTATLLTTGQVLVVGGETQAPPTPPYPGPGSAAPTNSAELFTLNKDNKASKGEWSLTGSMSTPRVEHTATLLPNGQVLVVGGSPDFFSCVATAELFNPATGQWTATASMTSPRCNHAAVLLTNGQVLIAGGQAAATVCSNGTCHSGDSLDTAELYNPETGTWQATANMNAARAFIGAELLLNGKVLVAAGEDITNGTNTSLSSAELFDPSQGRWDFTANLVSPARNVGARLDNGDVLLLRQALFNPTTGTWSVTGPYPTSVGPGGTGATLLGTGNVLVTGFVCNYSGCAGAPTNAAVLYESSTNGFVMTSPMTIVRKGASQTLLRNGQVLVAGGYNKQTLCSGCSIAVVFLASAELYTP